MAAYYYFQKSLQPLYGGNRAAMIAARTIIAPVFAHVSKQIHAGS
jgi:hypothetical protein